MAQLKPEDAEKVAGLAVVQNQKIVDWYRQVVLPARRAIGPSALEKYTYSFDIDEMSPVFEKPSLILLGRQDTHVGYQDGWAILDFFPRATLAVLDRAGHALGVEQEGLFQALINEWLDRVEEFPGRIS
jgi:pimeloyl-ACP methyl ester carboxylesterase